MSAVLEAVANVDCPATLRDDVAVRVANIAELPERVVMYPVTALSIFVKRLVEVIVVLVRLVIEDEEKVGVSVKV